MNIWRMRITCWMTKATHTLRICNTSCFCTETVVPQYDVISTLPVLLTFWRRNYFF